MLGLRMSGHKLCLLCLCNTIIILKRCPARARNVEFLGLYPIQIRLIGYAITLYLPDTPRGLNRFQPQIDRVQNRGTFLWTVISENIVLESVTFQFHVRMLSSAQLWTFFRPWGRDRSKSPPCLIFRVKQIHQSTASEMTTRQTKGVVYKTTKHANNN